KDLFRKSIQSDTIALAEDDILLVYTDGVTEAMNPKRRLFGEERFLRLIREAGKKTADEFIETLRSEMNVFTEGSEQNDDITLVAIKEKMSAEQVEYGRAVRAYQLVQNGIGIKEACRESGISTYSYYQKYKERFDSEGVGSYVASEVMDQVEAKHLSIEEKNKIFDIIRRFPEYGAKRISEELRTERYEFAEIPISRIYEELVRMRLNTKELREAFVQRGGKKKRIKAPGTPMMTLDGKLIMNRTQYEEADDEKEPHEEEVKPDTTAAEEKDAAQSEAPAEESKEWTTPNVFAIDKKTLLMAPLEDIFDKRPKEEEAPPAETGEPQEEEAPQVESGEPPAQVDEDEDLGSLFSFVDDDASAREMAEAERSDDLEAASSTTDRFTIVSEDELKEFHDADLDENDEMDQIEETLFGERNELDMLSDYRADDADDFGLEFGFAEETDVMPDEQNPDFENDQALQDEEEVELFDLNSGFPDVSFADSELDAPEDESVLAQEDADAEFAAPSPQDDDLFENWMTESSEETANDGNNGRDEALSPDSEIFSQDHDFADPFEEFLELEDEFGLIGDDGDLDQELSDTLLASENSFSEVDDDDQPTKVDQEQDVEHGRDVDEKDERISLDRLVSVSNDEESFFAQHDEEFDELIKDAMTNDGKMQQFLHDHAPVDEDASEQNRIIEAEIRDAMHLYGESQFDAAIKKLNSLAEKYPRDHRAHSLLGNAYFREKKFKQASNEYERVIDLDPMNEKACENLAISYAKQGEFEKAIHHWERLLHIAPDRMDVRARIQRTRAFLEKY
ncbi:SpoIIE family protein phosphatase, partial [candidate division KSB1 bacterium]